MASNRNRTKYIYMAVTADQFENVIAECESAAELSEIIGVSVNAIYLECSAGIKDKKHRNGRYRGFRILRVEDEDG